MIRIIGRQPAPSRAWVAWEFPLLHCEVVDGALFQLFAQYAHFSHILQLEMKNF